MIKCWDCLNRTVSKKVEDDIKRYFKVNKLNTTYEGQTEIIKSNKIDDIIKIFDGYVDKRVDEYDQLFTNKELEQKIKLIEKINETIINIKNTDNSNAQITTNDLMKILGIKDEIKENNTNEKSEKENSIIKEFEESIQYCRHCNKNKKVEEFGLNEKTNTYFKQCIQCREKCKVSDLERRTKYKNEHKDAEILHPQKQKQYQENHDEIRQKQKEYYEENKSEIIEQKKKYIQQRINNITDPNKQYCKKCHTIKTLDEFGVNNKTSDYYKQCILCRVKQTKLK